jgi:ABC-type uncharacterized transport system permease subunit
VKLTTTLSLEIQNVGIYIHLTHVYNIYIHLTHVYNIYINLTHVYNIYIHLTHVYNAVLFWPKELNELLRLINSRKGQEMQT